MATTINSGYANSPKLTANIADHSNVHGGRSLVFDGVSDYLTLGVVEELKGGSQKTISAWIKTSNTNNVTILGNTQSGGYNINIYQNQLGVSFHNGSYRNVYTSDFSTNTWHHVVGTYDNRYAKLYIDGELKGTTDSGSNLDLTSVNVAFLIGAEVGGDSNPSGGYYNGSLCDVKIWNTAITESEIQSQYKKPESVVNQDNLVAWYPMIEGNPESPQSIVYDHSEKKLGSDFARAVTADNWNAYANMTINTITGGISIVAPTTASGVSVSSNGAYIYFRGGTFSGENQLTTKDLTVGKQYCVTFNAYYSGGASGVYADISNGSSFSVYSDAFTTTNKSYKMYFTAGTATTALIRFQQIKLDNIVYITDIEVKEVLMGNHATTNFFGDELIENGGFENDGANWTDIGTPTTSEVNTTGTYVNSGSKSWKITTDGFQEGVMQDLGSDEYEVGKTYTVEAYVYLVDSITVELWINGNQIETTSTTGSFVKLSGTFVASGSNRTLTVRTISGSANGTYYIDDVSVKEVGISSSGFMPVTNEPVVPQVPLIRYNQKMFFGHWSLNQYVSTGQAFNFGKKVTISIWLIPNEIISTSRTGIIGGRYYQNGDFHLGLHDNTRQIIFTSEANVGGQWNLSADQWDIGKLVHLCLVYDTSQTGNSGRDSNKLYVNSILQTPISGVGGTVDLKTYGLNIGHTNQREYNGFLDEASIFNSAFTQTQVQELFNNGVAYDATTHSKKGNLLAYYRNDGVTTWKDRRGWSFLDLDGTGDYVAIGSAIGDMSEKDVSVTVWFNSRNISDQKGIISQQDGTGTGRFLLYNESNKLKSFLGGAEHSVSTNLQANKWHHACYTMNSSTNEYKLYLDGQLGDSGTDAIESADGNFFIGTSKTLGSAVFDGGIAQLALFDNKTLSPDEVLEQYNNGVATKFTTEGMTHHYVFNDDTTIVDLINSSNGTVNGNPTLNDGNDGDVQGSPDSITIREGLNSNRDGLGFYFTNPSSNVLRLNGVDEFLEIDDSDVFSFGDSVGDLPFTISAWIKPRGASALFRILDKSTSTSVVEYNLSIDSSSKCTLALYDSSTSNVIFRPSSSSIVADQWTFVTATYNGSGSNSGINIYINDALNNGTASSSGSYTAMHNTTSTLKIGIRKFDNSFGNGLIDELRVYNKELSLAEIQKNYKHQKGKHKND